MLAKVKNLIKGYEKDIVLVIIIVFVAMISFGLGRLSKIKESRTPLLIENAQNTTEVQKQVSGFKIQDEGIVVASKNGTKYHYPWCSGAAAIKEENKVTFGSIEEARKAGYLPASNCKGLK